MIIILTITLAAYTLIGIINGIRILIGDITNDTQTLVRKSLA